MLLGQLRSFLGMVGRPSDDPENALHRAEALRRFGALLLGGASQRSGRLRELTRGSGRLFGVALDKLDPFEQSERRPLANKPA